MRDRDPFRVAVKRSFEGSIPGGATLDRIVTELSLAIVETEGGHPDLKGESDGIVS